MSSWMRELGERGMIPRFLFKQMDRMTVSVIRQGTHEKVQVIGMLGIIFFFSLGYAKIHKYMNHVGKDVPLKIEDLVSKESFLILKLTREKPYTKE